jgi:hypothetical protein
MATTAQPESGREAPDASAAAAREASTPIVVPTVRDEPVNSAGAPAAPAPARNEGESGEQYKARVNALARDKAMALARDRALPGVAAPPLDPKTVDEKLADIHDPVKALEKDAAAKAADPAATPAEGDEPAATETAGAEAAPAEGETALADGEQKPETDAGPAGITVELAVPGQEAPFLMEVGDQESADILTDLNKRAARGDQARAIREQATLIRDDAEDERDRFKMVVDLDPAGVLQESVTDPRDQVHLAKFLLTQPGVLENVKDWIAAALEDSPEDAAKRAELLELERYKRRDAVKDAVEKNMKSRRDFRHEKRSVALGIHQAIESLAPEVFTKDSLDALYEDVAADVEAVRQNSPSKRIDGRNIPAIVTRRLKLYGHAPRGEKPVVKTGETTRPSAPAAVKTTGVPAKPAADTKVAPKTAQALRTAARQRQDATTASPGAGAQVSRTPAPPPYDPAQKGNALEQRFAWARKTLIPSNQRRPV